MEYNIMGRSKTSIMTVECRLQALRQIADDFSTHLMSVPGTILPPSLRLGVAICARDALTKCQTGCNPALIQKVCLRPGASFYDFSAKMQHEPAFPASDHGKLDTDIAACLLSITHTFICHQNQIDAICYDDAVSTLQSCGILSDYAQTLNGTNNEKELEFASRVVYCEIILVAAISHCIHISFLALGMDVPALPTWGDMKDAPNPSNIRFSSLLKRIRKGDSSKVVASFAPYFAKTDLNIDSPEYSKIGEDVWKEFDHMLMLPWSCTKFALQDFVVFNRVKTAMYLPFSGMLTQWGEIDSTAHCPLVTRFDIETVAAAVAAEHECTY
mmetsp:Transcript_8932/g.15802  ORF Transcript_8932/g.15802 Transcript_8932/m.15802 type:complete len:328 (-) Transcript_8932:593-1576(-)